MKLIATIGVVLVSFFFWLFTVQLDKNRKNMHDYQLEINDGYYYTLFDNGRVVAHFDTLDAPFLDSIIYKDNE